ncbi:hypothetical protein BKA64DRAFT_757778 [Cadophora sp. MPI-SDFR-AT-0126]|nr:hypothetical protein BKA64DRAFT_757778 [Leotiomycetes sp. MPI-SDFR-AT-0126]
MAVRTWPTGPKDVTGSQASSGLQCFAPNPTSGNGETCDTSAQSYKYEMVQGQKRSNLGKCPTRATGYIQTPRHWRERGSSSAGKYSPQTNSTLLREGTQELKAMVKRFQEGTNGMEHRRKTVQLCSYRTSQIAAKYCADHGRKYTAMLWFDTRTQAAFRVSCSMNAIALGLVGPEEKGQFDLERKRIKEWLARGDEIQNLQRRKLCWLVVFDDDKSTSTGPARFNDLVDIKQILPNSHTFGSVIQTTLRPPLQHESRRTVDNGIHHNASDSFEVNNFNVDFDFDSNSDGPLMTTAQLYDEDSKNNLIPNNSNSNSSFTTNSTFSLDASSDAKSKELLLLIESFSDEDLAIFFFKTLTDCNYKHPDFTKANSIKIADWCDRDLALFYAVCSEIARMDWRFEDIDEKLLMDKMTGTNGQNIEILSETANILAEIAACFSSAGVNWELFEGRTQKYL